MLSNEIRTSIDSSVLCWLATSSAENVPNVSPKEIFAPSGDDTILIANIASPQSAANILANPNVCVSLIDVLVQKGFQLKGTATIVRKDENEFARLAEPLLTMTQGKFPFATLFKVKVTNTKPIIAPRYLLYPETTEQQQIKAAKRVYGLADL